MNALPPLSALHGSWLLLATLLVLAGLGQALGGYVALRRLLAETNSAPGHRPPVSILKPLHGDEPLLEAALASMCEQDWPEYQIVFGVAQANDTALAVVRRIQARFPARDIAVVVNATQHGSNRKVGNLINMLPAARHEVLVIADSDVHAPADWLAHLVAGLGRPGIGLVTTLYTGLVGVPGLFARLGAAQINHAFLPGALLARWMGRQDCFGASMAIRRGVLERIGGLHALADGLADDAVLGQRVVASGLGVALAPCLPATTVPEAGFRALWRHEMRWARTVRSLEPAGHAASVLQYPLAWALLAVAGCEAAQGPVSWAVLLFLAAWLARAAIARATDEKLRHIGALATPASFWLLPLRDLLSICVIAASFTGHQVEWRGQIMQAYPARLAPEEG